MDCPGRVGVTAHLAKLQPIALPSDELAEPLEVRNDGGGAFVRGETDTHQPCAEFDEDHGIAVAVLEAPWKLPGPIHCPDSSDGRALIARAASLITGMVEGSAAVGCESKLFLQRLVSGRHREFAHAVRDLMQFAEDVVADDTETRDGVVHIVDCREATCAANRPPGHSRELDSRRRANRADGFAQAEADVQDSSRSWELGRWCKTECKHAPSEAGRDVLSHSAGRDPASRECPQPRSPACPGHVERRAAVDEQAHGRGFGRADAE